MQLFNLPLSSPVWLMATVLDLDGITPTGYRELGFKGGSSTARFYFMELKRMDETTEEVTLAVSHRGTDLDGRSPVAKDGLGRFWRK